VKYLFIYLFYFSKNEVWQFNFKFNFSEFQKLKKVSSQNYILCLHV
jgi:hypothetical protein